MSFSFVILQALNNGKFQILKGFIGAVLIFYKFVLRMGLIYLSHLYTNLIFHIVDNKSCKSFFFAWKSFRAAITSPAVAIDGRMAAAAWAARISSGPRISRGGLLKEIKYIRQVQADYRQSTDYFKLAPSKIEFNDNLEAVPN